MRKLILALLVGVLASTNAFAGDYIKHPGAQHEPEDTITPMLGASAIGGLEVGAKADYLLANPGFVPSINNSVFIEGSVFLDSRDIFIAPLLRWDFHLHPQWTVYGGAGIEIAFQTGHDTDYNPVGIDAQAGAIWRIPQHSYALRAEIDLHHASLRVGPMIQF